MRRAQDSWTAGSLAFLVATLLAGTGIATGQFREIDGSAQSPSDSSQLTPTSEPFIPPPANNPAKPATKPLAASQGEPTPAAPQPPKKASSRRTAVAAPAADAQDGEENKIEAEKPTAVVQSQAQQTVVDPFDHFQTANVDLPPSADAASVVSPIVFQGIALGKSTVEDIRQVCGDPIKTVEVDGVEKLIFGMTGFRQVDVLTNGTGVDDATLTVESIVVHLAESLTTAELTEKLSLSSIVPVDVKDEAGTVLGIAFPERGVLLGFSDSGPGQISTISLEPIRGELFRMRAEEDRTCKYSQCLADLERAVQLDPGDAHALWLKSELLAKIGRVDDALQCVTDAVERSPEGLYRLTKARLLGEQARLREAIRETRAVIADHDAADIVKARAEYQLGNLLATGTEADYEKALASHLKSIDSAAKEMHSQNAKVRRMAKDILVDAHLSIAQDIALGNFQRQTEVVPKWLTRASELADAYIHADQGDETLRMDIYRTTLAIYSILPGNFDASVAAEEALEEGKRLISAATDPVFEQRMRRELIETLFYAAKVEQQRGRADNAMKYAENATVLIDIGSSEPACLFDQYVAGQVYFLVGSLAAVQKKDHLEAVEWYQKALPILDSEDIGKLVATNSFGELFVSMGVSFWEIDQRDEALELTQRGTALMQDAVQEGILPLESLSVAYGNLAAMHGEIGNAEKARHFAEMLAKVEKDAKAGVKQR
jgi:tetratricopeptide (TPR) repeat protein